MHRAARPCSSVRIQAAASHCWATKRSMMSREISLAVGRAVAGALYLPVDVGLCDRIISWPKIAGASGTRCHTLLGGLLHGVPRRDQQKTIRRE